MDMDILEASLVRILFSAIRIRRIAILRLVRTLLKPLTNVRTQCYSFMRLGRSLPNVYPYPQIIIGNHAKRAFSQAWFTRPVNAPNSTP